LGIQAAEALAAVITGRQVLATAAVVLVAEDNFHNSSNFVN